MMPSPTRRHLLDRCRDMADRLGVQHDEISIAPGCSTSSMRPWRCCSWAVSPTPPKKTFRRAFVAPFAHGLVQQDRRHRADHRQQEQRWPQATAPCTATWQGGFAVIKDLVKTLVYRLARWRNAEALARGEVEPFRRIIVRPPSAELRPIRRTRTACPNTMCSTTPSWSATWSKTSPSKSSWRRVFGRRGKVTRLLKIERVQAPPGTRSASASPPCVWSRLALPGPSSSAPGWPQT